MAFLSVVFVIWSPVGIFGIKIGVQRFVNGVCCEYKLLCGGVLIDVILMKLSVRSLGIGTVLIVSHDSVWENIQGLMVFCHKSRQVSILWRSGLGILGCRVDGVLQPSGQRCPHPFLASFRRYT